MDILEVAADLVRRDQKARIRALAENTTRYNDLPWWHKEVIRKVRGNPEYFKYLHILDQEYGTWSRFNAVNSPCEPTTNAVYRVIVPTDVRDILDPASILEKLYTGIRADRVGPTEREILLAFLPRVKFAYCVEVQDTPPSPDAAAWIDATSTVKACSEEDNKRRWFRLEQPPTPTHYKVGDTVRLDDGPELVVVEHPRGQRRCDGCHFFDGDCKRARMVPRGEYERFRCTPANRTDKKFVHFEDTSYVDLEVFIDRVDDIFTVTYDGHDYLFGGIYWHKDFIGYVSPDGTLSSYMPKRDGDMTKWKVRMKRRGG